jgi:hypothetical protein
MQHTSGDQSAIDDGCPIRLYNKKNIIRLKNSYLSLNSNWNKTTRQEDKKNPI